MRRDERVTVQGPVKEQQPDGMSHRGGGGDLGRVDDRRAEVRGSRKQSNDPRNNQHVPRYASYRALLTHKRHPSQPTQPRHTNDWAPRTRKRQQQDHRPQRPTERSDPTQHAKGRAGDCPGSRKETATRRHVALGGGGISPEVTWSQNSAKN